MSLILIAELATSHGGDVSLAEDMIRAAADAGCTYAKTQAYSLSHLNPADPQREWLAKARLTKQDHERLMVVCQQVGIGYLSTPFDPGTLAMLRELGLKTFKIASSESGNDWWTRREDEMWFISWPWGQVVGGFRELTPLGKRHCANLTAIPLYPTPLEAVGRATLLDGWSDHCEGLSACLWAIAQGVQVLEAHLCFPERGRRTDWDKLPQDFATLRRFADDIETLRSGVSTQFRRRWSA